MLEWLKRHAWKACVPQKGIASSNLALSAKTRKAALRASAGLFWYAADWELAHWTKYAETARATVRSWAAFLSLQAPWKGTEIAMAARPAESRSLRKKKTAPIQDAVFLFYPEGCYTSRACL